LRGFGTRRFQRCGDFRERSSATLGGPTLGVPRLGDYERELVGRSAREKGDASHTRVDPGRIYTFPELIDLAQRNNPETRVAWERACMAAAGVGLSESLYYPYLAASAGAGYERA